PILASARSALPEVGSLSVTDRNGIITHSTVRAIVGHALSSTYVFKQLSSSPADELGVDRPFLSITTPRHFIIPIGRRLLDANGAFDGTAVATLLPEAYREFFPALELGPRR